MRSLLFSTILIAFVATANAQLDPSSALLLNSGRTTPVRESGIDSGRYTVKPRTETAVRQERPERVERPVRVRPVDHENLPVDLNQVAATPTPSPTPEPDAATPQSVEVKDAHEVVDQPTNEAKTKRLPPRQLTMLDLSVSPGYLYNGSRSAFTYRNYNLSSPVLGLDANVWFGPNFGLHTGFMGTSNAQVKDALDGQRQVAVTQQWFLIGLRARKFFGFTETSPVLTFGVDYQEYQFRVPSDSLLRGKLASTGPVVSLEAEIPSSATTSWTLGATYAPKLKHKETSNATEFSSGTGPSASSVGFSFGSRYRFDRTHSIFWKFTQTVEKNVFSGETSVPDPISGQTQSGTGVTNSMSLFQLGYTWAD